MDEGGAESFTFYWRVWVTWTSSSSFWNLRAYQFWFFRAIYLLYVPLFHL